jgi:hypothetical protein
MMQVTRGEPVMWISAISLLHSGPYAEANMSKWDAALMQACTRYPNMRVFDWPALAKPDWFINDGIHYTSAGYEKRALYIADGLAMAFPASGPSSNCLVNLPTSITSPPPGPSPSPSGSGPTPGGTAPGMRAPGNRAPGNTAPGSTAAEGTTPGASLPTNSSPPARPAARSSP